jgi:hypothetical protein
MDIKKLKPNKKAKTQQGYFNISESTKYFGKEKKVIYRSSWEYMFCTWCEKNPKVQNWASESIAIKYVCPLDNIVKNYYPDFIVKMIDDSFWIVEVKPEREYKIFPEKPKRKTQKSLANYEYLLNAFLVNQSKFKSAKHYCELKNWKFIVVDENWFKISKSK